MLTPPPPAAADTPLPDQEPAQAAAKENHLTEAQQQEEQRRMIMHLTPDMHDEGPLALDTHRNPTEEDPQEKPEGAPPMTGESGAGLWFLACRVKTVL